MNNEDVVWDALARALAGEYDIVACLGMGGGAAPVYLARELVTDTFVALRLPPLVSGKESQEYGLEIVRQLDGSLPEIETHCPYCNTTVRRWSRLCPQCHRDISGLSPKGDHTRDRLRTIAGELARGRFELLGEMPRADGGGLVYFGRDLANWEVVGLQLEPNEEGGMRLTETRFAAPDPTIQIQEARDVSGALGRRVVVPAETDRHAAPTNRAPANPPPPSRKNPSSAVSLRRLAVAAVILLLVMAAWMTCRVV